MDIGALEDIAMTGAAIPDGLTAPEIWLYVGLRHLHAEYRAGYVSREQCVNETETAVALKDIDSRCKSNTHRIDALEKSNEALNRLATSVEVMAAKQGHIAEKVDGLDSKVEALEKVPAGRWNDVVKYIITALLAAALTALAAYFGGGGA